MRAAAAVVVLALFSVLPSVARADDKQACVASFEEAQRLRKASRLVEARAQLALCARDACPAVLRDPCIDWLREVDAELPTIVVSAKDAGGDVIDASIEIDGKLVASKIDGKPIAVDPGDHVVKITSGARSVEQKVVVAQAEKNRLVKLVFADAAPKQPAPEAPSRIPTATFVLGGIGVVSLGAFAYFGLTGMRELDRMRAPGGCAPTCTDDDLSRARTRLIVADVALGLGLVSLGAATAVLIAAPSSEPRAAVTLGPNGAFLVGAF